VRNKHRGDSTTRRAPSQLRKNRKRRGIWKKTLTAAYIKRVEDIKKNQYRGPRSGNVNSTSYRNYLFDAGPGITKEKQKGNQSSSLTLSLGAGGEPQSLVSKSGNDPPSDNQERGASPRRSPLGNHLGRRARVGRVPVPGDLREKLRSADKRRTLR